MEFASHSKKWVVRVYPGSPEQVIKSLIDACARRFPSDALGHAKAFIEFGGGSIFASSTITSQEITIRTEGNYRGGDMILSVTLIFMGLTVEFLKEVLSQAVAEVCEDLGCTLEESREVF